MGTGTARPGDPDTRYRHTGTPGTRYRHTGLFACLCMDCNLHASMHRTARCLGVPL